MRFFGSDHVIRGNYFHGVSWDEVGTAHVDCFQTFDNNGEIAVNILFEGNVCDTFHQGLMGEALFNHNSHDLVFRNNVFMHSGAWGLAVEGITNVYAYNNVFADILYHGIGCREGATCVASNNIFYDADTGYWADGGTISGDHNLLFKQAGAYTPGDFPNDIVNVDPLFVGGDDFHLLAGSPAIDTGSDLSGTGFADDAVGTTRPQGAGWDIGAYEYCEGGCVAEGGAGGQAGGAGAGGSGLTGGAAGSGGSGALGPNPVDAGDEEGGCGCGLPGRASLPGGLAGLAAALGLIAVRRRRLLRYDLSGA